MMTKQEEICKAMMELFPNAYKIITIKETRLSRQIAKDVRKYVMAIEEAHKKAAHSKLRFRYGN